MSSTPAAIMISVSPAMIARAASIVADIADGH
jgi:hypothetical protein